MCGALERLEQRGVERGVKQGLEQGIEQGLEQGIKQGIKKEKKFIILQMLKKGMDQDLIKEITGMDAAVIEEIQREMKI